MSAPKRLAKRRRVERKRLRKREKHDRAAKIAGNGLLSNPAGPSEMNLCPNCRRWNWLLRWNAWGWPRASRWRGWGGGWGGWRRICRDSTRFGSTPLAQARVLTPFQAAELNAGRGNSLRIGPFLLCERLAHPCYVASYRAKNVDSARDGRLAIVENAGPRADAILGQLKFAGRATIAGSQRIAEGGPDPADLGAVGSRLWPQRHNPKSRNSPCAAVSRPPLPHSPLSPTSAATANGSSRPRRGSNGRTAAEWIVHHGRFPPEVVLEIARAMLAELVESGKDRRVPRRREHVEPDVDRRRRRRACDAWIAGDLAAGRGLRPCRSAARGVR